MKYAVAVIVLSAALATDLASSGVLSGPGIALGHGQAEKSIPIRPGDSARGKIVFEKRCTGCHALEENREGPRLHGVFGRKAGSVPGFDYSLGLKNSGIIWNEHSLDRWLSNPDMVVSDNNMGFHVPKAQERADLITYFKDLKESH